MIYYNFTIGILANSFLYKCYQIHMHKRMPPHGDYNHMGETINLVNNFKVDKVILIVDNIMI